MDVNNIDNNGGISKKLIEQNKFLSAQEKEKMLSVFCSIDGQEEDDVKDNITTAESLGLFLKETKNNLGDKRYDKFLDSAGLSYLKNDKNMDGVISEEDFSDVALDKLRGNDLLRIFQGQKWSPEIAKIFSSVINNTQLKENFINMRIINNGFRTNKNIMYDVKSKTLKIADDVDTYYCSFKKYQYDKNGLLLSKQELNTIEEYHVYYKDGKMHNLSDWSVNWLAEQEGFPPLSDRKLSEEKEQLYKDIFDGKYGNVWRKSEYKYDKKGKVIENKEYIRDEIKTSTWQNGVKNKITRKSNGDFVSHTKTDFSWVEENNTRTEVVENYDEQGNFMYKTTTIEKSYDTPKVINDKNGKKIGIDSDTRVIKEYSDGKVEETYTYEESSAPIRRVVPEYTDHKEFKDLSFERKDGFKFDIKDTSETSSVITVTTPEGKSFSINCKGDFDRDFYHNKQLPELKNLLDKLPPKVLEDLSNEILDINLMKFGSMDLLDGFYAWNTNVMTILNPKQLTTIIHEIGHALDNNNSILVSKSPEYVRKFNRLQELAQKLNINDENHALEMPEEFFASVYANQELNGGKTDFDKINPEILQFNPDHIEVLNYRARNFKNSNNPDEREFYEIFESLKADTISGIESIRKLPKSERCDTTPNDLVKTELKDILDKMNKNYYQVIDVLLLPEGDSLELELLTTLTADDDTYNSMMELYQEISEAKIPVTEDVQKIFAELIPKLQDARAKIKAK